MASLNKCLFIGNLGRDPEIRATQDGSRIANLNVAVSERWTDKNTGEVKERTEWVRVAAFNDRVVDYAEKYLSKGSLVYVEGQMQTRKWTDKDGAERYTTEIVISRFRGELLGLDRRDKSDAAAADDGEGPPF